MLVKIVHIGNCLFVPATSQDAATARSFGAEDNEPMGKGHTLHWWKEFRHKTGVRVLRPA